MTRITTETNVKQEASLSLRQRYKRAELKIGEMERENSQLRNAAAKGIVVIHALAEKLNASPEEVTNIFIEYAQRKEAEHALKVNEQAKKDFAEKLARGENVKIINRIEGEQPEVAQRDPQQATD